MVHCVVGRLMDLPFSDGTRYIMCNGSDGNAAWDVIPIYWSITRTSTMPIAWASDAPHPADSRGRSTIQKLVSH
jgi:hypothetical protein